MRVIFFERKKNIFLQTNFLSTLLRSNGTTHLCVSDDCPQNRKLSFTQEPDVDAVMNFTGTALILNSDLLAQQLSDHIAESGNAGGVDKPELTCISEEGIADMDLPDNLFEDFDYIGDCITSCNKVLLQHSMHFHSINSMLLLVHRWKTI